MKNLKRLSAAVVLTFVLGLSALAGEVDTPPGPGKASTLPSASGQTMTLSNSTTPGEVETPPKAQSLSLTEIATGVLRSLLSLF
jgi:hypothetical protein